MSLPQRIYLASTSAGKLKDFAAAAGQSSAPSRIEFLLLPGLAAIPAPPEDEPTFAANARAKALAYAREAALRTPALSGALLLADDSGLEVDALDGAPGVRSARYADDHAYASGIPIDDRNNRLLLENLRGAISRTARYRCALALARCGLHPELIAEADGVLEGEILPAPRGEGGFGYDPLFFIPEAGRTMAELAVDQRLQFSHRGRALRRLLDQGWKEISTATSA